LKQFGFPSDQRLKSKIEISEVFENGFNLYSSKNSLRAKILIKNSVKGGTKAAFAVYKKSGKAVWRNRVKRLLRESFRQNKAKIIPLCSANNKSLLIVFTLNKINEKNYPKIKLSDVFDEMVSLLNAVEKRIIKSLDNL